MSEQCNGSSGRNVRYGYSRLTGNWYRVTEWKDLGNGKMVAQSKERVDEEDVPDLWRGQ